MKFVFLSVLASTALAAPLARWTMLDVSSLQGQAEANLVELSDKKFLIDAGEADHGRLLGHLNARGIKRIDEIYISHLHRDHYVAIPKLIAGGIEIGRIRVHVPPKVICDREKPWGCSWDETQAFMAKIREAGIPVTSMEKDEVLYKNGSTELKAVLALKDDLPHETPLDVNDLSQVLSLRVGKRRVLFSGDLNNTVGTWLVRHRRKDLKAEFLKVPHHGADSTVPNTFFQAVQPRYAFVSTPWSVWNGERAQRVRAYLEKNRIKTYVTAVDGSIQVDLNNLRDPVLTSREFGPFSIP